MSTVKPGTHRHSFCLLFVVGATWFTFSTQVAVADTARLAEGTNLVAMLPDFPGVYYWTRSTSYAVYPSINPAFDSEQNEGPDSSGISSFAEVLGAPNWARAQGAATTPVEVPPPLARGSAGARGEAAGDGHSDASGFEAGSTIVATSDFTMLLSMDYSYRFDNLPQNSGAAVYHYVAFWVSGDPLGDHPLTDLLLVPPQNWQVGNLGTQSNPYYVLGERFDLEPGGSVFVHGTTTWTLNIQAGVQYSWMSSVRVDPGGIPEPSTGTLFTLLALMGVMRRR